MSLEKYIVNIVLSFLLMVSVIILVITNIVNTKLLNKTYILSKIEEIEFVQSVHREIENEFQKYIQENSLPEDAVENIISENALKEDIQKIVNYLYSNGLVREEKNFLEYKIDEYFNIQDYSLIQNLKEANKKIGNIPFIVTVLLALLIILINLNHILYAINFVSISTLSIGVFFKLAVTLIFNNIDLDNLYLFTISLSNLFISVIKEHLYILSDYSDMFLIFGIAGIVLVATLKKVVVRRKAKRSL